MAGLDSRDEPVALQGIRFVPNELRAPVPAPRQVEPLQLVNGKDDHGKMAVRDFVLLLGGN